MLQTKWIKFFAACFLSAGLFFVNTAKADHCAQGDVHVYEPKNPEDKKYGSVISVPPGTAPVDSEKGKYDDLGCQYGSDLIPASFGSPVTDPRANIRLAINITMSFLGTVIVAMILYGGFQWITAAGKEEMVTKGKHTLVWAAVGGIVVSIAWSIASYILQAGRIVGGG